MKLRPRRVRPGSTMATAVVMTGVIFAVGTAVVTMVGNAGRKATSERWQSVADEAAKTGLGMVVAYARAHADRYKTMPTTWDLADGEMLNPMGTYFASELANIPGLPAPRTRGVLGDNLNPPRPGDLVGFGTGVWPSRPGNAMDVGEYVTGVYGTEYVATCRPRLQVFRMDEQEARLYKVAVAGRVYKRDNSVDRPGHPMDGWRVQSDRVLVATLGRLPLSRFATLIDVDLVKNWVPGELSDGPVHINRGYVDAQAAGRPAGTNAQSGRSQMVLNAPGAFGNVNVPGEGNFSAPQFRDTMSFTFNRGQGDSNTSQPAPGPLAVIPTAGGAPTSYLTTPSRAADMFTSPDNQAQVNGQAGPILLENNIAMPANSRARLPAALGLPAGRGPADFAWLNGPGSVKDGVYIASRQLSTALGANSYAGGNNDGVPGGIYIRGTVSQMRSAVYANTTVLFFEVIGRGASGASGLRSYAVRYRRNNAPTEGLTIMAGTPGTRLDAAFPTGTNWGAAAPPGGSQENLDAWSVSGAGPIFKHFNNPAAPAFNGLVFVDYSHSDPVRAGLGSTALVAAGGGVEPLSGHILALGRVGNPGAYTGAPLSNFNKGTAYAGSIQAGFGAPFNTAELFSTEYFPAGIPAPRIAGMATRMTVIAAGNIFIQNHLLTEGVTSQLPGVTPGVINANLKRSNILLSRSRDILGLVADRQVVVGMAAPNGATRGDPGLVVTAAVSALGDPSYSYAGNNTGAMPAVGSPAYKVLAYRGSLATEGLVPLMIPNQSEDYRIGLPGGLFANPPGFALTPAPAAGMWGMMQATTPNPGFQGPNPIYVAMGVDPRIYTSPAANPNLAVRGKLVFFGSVVQRKRGVVGMGNRSYDKAYRYDQRLLSAAPPLFPNAINLVTFTSAVNSAGMPPYVQPELRMLNNPPGGAGF